jgi:hypothetical protein
MSRNAEFHQLIERLVDHDRPLEEGEMEKYRNNIERQLGLSRRRVRNALFVVLLGIPATIVGQIVAVESSRVGTTVPGWIGLVALALAFGGMILTPAAALWLILFYIPRYIRARWDFRDSMLAILVAKVDELSRRLDTIAEKK